jgi:hypothetical protein
LRVDFSDLKKTFEKLEKDVLKEKSGHIGLCGRCENRARALETGSGPRFECSDFSSNKHSCYMYKPTAPILFKREAGDRRPLLLNALSCKVEVIRIAKGEYILRKVKGGHLVYWKPKEIGGTKK